MNRAKFRLLTVAIVILTSLQISTQAKAADEMSNPADELRAVETAFAATMADRDLAAFANFLSPETIFFGSQGALRGVSAVTAAWSAYFEGPEAPFSWRPETVEVLDSGTLGHSSGPVFDAQGKRIATFNSVWRKEKDGRWRVVFDKGCAVCE